MKNRLIVTNIFVHINGAWLPEREIEVNTFRTTIRVLAGEVKKLYPQAKAFGAVTDDGLIAYFNSHCAWTEFETLGIEKRLQCTRPYTR